MELIYIALLLHKAGKKIDEENVKKVVDAVGIKVDDTQIKALVASLDGVDIDKTLKEALIAPAVSAEAKPAEEKKEEAKEEVKSTEEAAAGLGALFG